MLPDVKFILFSHFFFLEMHLNTLLNVIRISWLNAQYIETGTRIYYCQFELSHDFALSEFLRLDFTPHAMHGDSLDWKLEKFTTNCSFSCAKFILIQLNLLVFPLVRLFCLFQVKLQLCVSINYVNTLKTIWNNSYFVQSFDILKLYKNCHRKAANIIANNNFAKILSQFINIALSFAE